MGGASQDSAAHRITLRFEDGVEKEIGAAPNEFVLDAALRQGVPLVYQCRSGSCSTCVAQLVAGDIAMAPGRATSLLASEAAEGRRLLCSSQARAGSVVRLHYPASLIYQNQRRAYAAAVAALEWPAANVAKLTLELPADSGFDFRGGQYVRIKTPGGEWRSYSMATTRRDLPRMDFLVRIIAGGMMSEYLRARCRPGDALEIEGPMGAFIPHPSRAPHIFIAGGTGLAPILAMIDDIRHRGGRRPSILLSFGCARERKFFYRDEIELRQWWMPELRVILSAGDAAETAEMVRGTPVSALDGEHIADPDTAAYICGPPPMIEAARRRLAQMGVKPDRIYAEQFVASAIQA
jgi:benzoate/toluate 1,2-dioxygenase reductase subunit